MLCWVLLALALAARHLLAAPPPAVTGLFVLAYIVGGTFAAISALGDLFRERTVSVDFLMIVAAIGAAIVAVADTLRPDARATIAALRAAGIERIVILTGDNQRVAAAIGAELGIDEFYADLPNLATKWLTRVGSIAGRMAVDSAAPTR